MKVLRYTVQWGIQTWSLGGGGWVGTVLLYFPCRLFFLPSPGSSPEIKVKQTNLRALIFTCDILRKFEIFSMATFLSQCYSVGSRQSSCHCHVFFKTAKVPQRGLCKELIIVSLDSIRFDSINQSVNQ